MWTSVPLDEMSKVLPMKENRALVDHAALPMPGTTARGVPWFRESRRRTGRRGDCPPTRTGDARWEGSAPASRDRTIVFMSPERSLTAAMLVFPRCQAVKSTSSPPGSISGHICHEPVLPGPVSTRGVPPSPGTSDSPVSGQRPKRIPSWPQLAPVIRARLQAVASPDRLSAARLDWHLQEAAGLRRVAQSTARPARRTGPDASLGALERLHRRRVEVANGTAGRRRVRTQRTRAFFRLARDRDAAVGQRQAHGGRRDAVPDSATGEVSGSTRRDEQHGSRSSEQEHRSARLQQLPGSVPLGRGTRLRRGRGAASDDDADIHRRVPPPDPRRSASVRPGPWPGTG